MWSSNRRGFLSLGSGAALAGLAGCRFTPVHGPGESGSKLQDRIFIPEPTTEDLYEVVSHFESRMGRAAQETASMKLALTASRSISYLGQTTTGYVTRLHMTGSLTFTLTNAKTGARIDRGNFSRFAGYSATGNTAAALAAERKAAKRVLVMLTDTLIDHLLLLDPAKLP